MINTVFWDIDGTLLNFLASEEKALTTCFGSFGIHLTEKQVKLYSTINDSFWKRLERGEINREEVKVGRFARLLKEIGREGINPRTITDCYEKELGDVFYFQDGAPDICIKLCGKVRQYIVTNGTEHVQRRKLKNSGLENWMDGTFISEVLGVDKPDKAFFDKCSESIPNYCREKTLIIGDSLTSDMLGGNKAGITCCWYNPEGKPIPANMPELKGLKIDYEIRHLDEVMEIIEK